MITTSRITFTLETTAGLTTDERRVMISMTKGGTSFEGLDDVEAFMRVAFRGWFVYRGGNHVSLHRADGSPRLLLITERR